MNWQQTILKAGLGCASFDDPLRFLSHLMTVGRRPALVICDLNLGNLSAEFLGKTLRMRYSDIELAVLLEDGATGKAKDFKGLGMRILSPAFGEAEIEALWEAIFR